MFDSIATLAVAANMRELYRLVLVDTPLAPYFAETLSSEDLDEMNIEILRNTLYKVCQPSIPATLQCDCFMCFLASISPSFFSFHQHINRRSDSCRLMLSLSRAQTKGFALKGISQLITPRPSWDGAG